MTRNEKFSSIGYVLNDKVKEHKLWKTKRKIVSIAIHCSASPQGRGDHANTIDRWHLERWGLKSGIGYHYVVLEDGTIEKGRWVDYPGAHIASNNSHTIGICRIGESKKDLTPNQNEALVELVNELRTMYDLSVDKVKGHKEYVGVIKTCPEMDMRKFRRDLTFRKPH